MPILSNSRYERFAQELAKGASATDAYEAAGYKPDRHNAAKLTTNHHVLTRVAELKARAADGLNVTQQWLIERANEVRLIALERGQCSAAIRAVQELGILTGHRVEKRESMHRSVNDMSDDELMAIVNGYGLTQH